MTLTISNWILFGVIFLIGLIFTIIFFHEDEEKTGIIIAIVTIVLIIALMFALSWYHTHTADGPRVMKDYQSDLNNGIERYLAVVADDGMVIYEREGKFDIEVHDTYIVFDENQVRTILYRSLTSTLIIEETGD